MKRIQILVAASAIVAVAACGRDDDGYDAYGNANPGTTPGATPAATAAPGTMPESADYAFFRANVTSSAREIELGRLAEQKATHADVKAFARRMVQDHQRAEETLRQAVGQAPAGVVADRDAIDDAKASLADKTGADFDRAYMDVMIGDHEDAVRRLERQANDPTALTTQSWAAQQLPTVREHLQQAQQIRQKLDKK